MADAVYFCEGWRESARCRIEHECAVSYGTAAVIEPAKTMCGAETTKTISTQCRLPGDPKEYLKQQGYRELRRCDFTDATELRAVFVGVNMYLTTGEEYTVRFMPKRNTVSVPKELNPADDAKNGGAEFGLSRFMIKR